MTPKYSATNERYWLQNEPPDTVTINPALAETGRRIAELMRRTGGVCSRCAEGVAWDVTPGCAAAGCPVQVVAREIAAAADGVNPTGDKNARYPS